MITEVGEENNTTTIVLMPSGFLPPPTNLHMPFKRKMGNRRESALKG
jgi:hypothetical protein